MVRFLTFYDVLLFKFFFLSLYKTHMDDNDIKFAVAIFGGLSALVGGILAGLRLSRCTLIRCCGCECRRDVPQTAAQV